MGQPARTVTTAAPPIRVVPTVPAPVKPEKKTFLTTEQVFARWEGIVKIQTLKNWRNAKMQKGPSFYKIGGKILYDLEDIVSYEGAGKVTHGVRVP